MTSALPVPLSAVPAHALDEGWWRDAVVYQVYVRSFADGNGDGIGDLAGLRSRLDHLSALGVDALWINPWYVSPMADGGYDVADFRAIAPEFGTLAEAEALIRDAHGRGIRVILDIVPNHTSTEHPWFRAALAGDPAKRSLYHFRPGRGLGGQEPPNDWQSAFGGPAWTRTAGPDGDAGDWYLHLYAPEQADLNWGEPAVHEEFLDILRFWFDRGVDGFRVDVAQGLVKADGLPDGGPMESATSPHTQVHPAWDQPGVHAIYREWRRLGDTYSPPRVFIAEAWVSSNARLARYVEPGQLHSAFQFDLLRSPWRHDLLRASIDEGLRTAAAVEGPSTWVLSNHDVPRQVTRYARSQPTRNVEPDWERRRWTQERPNLEQGRRRARAALALMAALPGSMYVYQGEELGLEEVEDLPAEVRQDPTWKQMGGVDPGRDGCRVPLPWSPVAPGLGFGPPGGAPPWLPQPRHWANSTVEAQASNPSSTLRLYQDAIRLRRALWLDAGELRWLPAPPSVLRFARGATECWVNISDAAVNLPDGDVLLSSEAAATPDGARLGPDAAVWLRARQDQR